MKMFEKLARYRDDQALVTIKRNGIEEHSLYGVVLDFSAELLLLRYEYDFLFDGYRVFRTADLTKISVTKSNRYCRKIMRSDGLWNVGEDYPNLDLKSWRRLFKSCGDEIIAIESEDDPTDTDFWIGSICKVGKETITFRGFDGCGEWMPVTTIDLSRITSIQLRNRYISCHARHLPPLPS
jgi:hypothetical protein